MGQVSVITDGREVTKLKATPEKPSFFGLAPSQGYTSLEDGEKMGGNMTVMRIGVQWFVHVILTYVNPFHVFGSLS